MERVLEICKDLVNFHTVTPGGREVLDCVANILTPLGFSVEILNFKSEDGSNSVYNLYAEFCSNENGPNLGFLGHLDTVPPGDGWEYDPFVATVSGDRLYGRGIADMKGGAGCFLASLEKSISKVDGKISIFLTCDEEIGTYEGAQALLKWAKDNGKIPTHCLIGEPSSNEKICDRIYIGHRGSINILTSCQGLQCHSAYVTKSTKNNPAEKIGRLIADVAQYEFKSDSRFPETIASPTVVECSNIAQNVIPGAASVNFNVRFSSYSSVDMVKIFQEIGKKYDAVVTYTPSGEPYICEDEKLLKLANLAISGVTGYMPEFSAGGGTSDGRFMIHYCPVVEMGVVDATIHKANEFVKIDDLAKLSEIYSRFIELYFQD